MMIVSAGHAQNYVLPSLLTKSNNNSSYKKKYIPQIPKTMNKFIIQKTTITCSIKSVSTDVKVLNDVRLEVLLQQESDAGSTKKRVHKLCGLTVLQFSPQTFNCNI